MSDHDNATRPDGGDGRPDLTVTDRPDDGRYDLLLDGDVVGFATYRLRDGVMAIPHVETAPGHRGNGFADTLMSGIVAHVRERGLSIRPICPYAASFMHDNRSTHDVLAV